MTTSDLATLLARAAQLQQRGRLQDAYALYLRIVDAQPDHAAANHELGLLLRRAGRRDEAIERLRAATLAEPRNAIYLSNFGVALMDAGRPAEAAASYEAALRLDPALHQTRSNLGVAQLALGQLEAAISTQHAVIAEAPAFAEAHANLGRALLENGAAEAAVERLEQAITLRPDYANAHYYLATALAALGRTEKSETATRQAIALQPHNAAAHYLLARLLHSQERLDEAIAADRRALELKPEPAVYRHLGDLLYAAGNDRDAVIAFRAGLELDSESAPLHAGLGRAQYRLGGTARAVESLKRAIALDPQNEAYRAALAPALVGAGLLDEASAYYHSSADADPAALGPRGALVFLGNYAADLPGAEVTRQARLYGEALASREASKRHSEYHNNRDPDRTLRIGLVSGDFNQHPVAFFLETVLAALDPRQVELFAYATSTVRDETTARLERSVPSWRDATRLDDDALDQAIVGDGIDILVDLSGHTQNARLAVFARKPAPVGVTWLGYSGTTGLQAIDYLLADRVVAPPEEEILFIETVWRLPDSYLCYSPPAEAPDVAPLPARTNGYLTFGSFNNLNKVNDRTLALWALLLAAVPNARLAFKSGGLRRRAAAATAGNARRRGRRSGSPQNPAL